MEFLDVEPTKFLKHVTTRWLSLEKTVNRTIQHWPALSSYFNSHQDVERDGKIKKLAEYFRKPSVKLYFHFLQFILAPLNEFNTAFQTDASKVGLLYQQMTRLLRKFFGKFVMAKVIAAQSKLTAVAFRERSNQLDDSYLAIGMPARALINVEEDAITPNELTKFFSAVRKFYGTVAQKMVDKFPFGSTILKDMAFLNPEIKGDLTEECVTNLADRFPNIVEEDSKEALVEEFREFQLSPPADLPPYSSGKDSLDHFWGEMEEAKESFGGKQLYSNLSKLAMACLVLPVSNADPERLFSMLKKVQTQFRSELGHDTICSILCIKQNMSTDCSDYNPSDDILKGRP